MLLHPSAIQERYAGLAVHGVSQRIAACLDRKCSKPDCSHVLRTHPHDTIGIIMRSWTSLDVAFGLLVIALHKAFLKHRFLLRLISLEGW